ncbi:hypothetical protein [Salarchaeum sp. JOR-1]|uniref:hypothetical protein n=1 Tax=Salarchaeum sp. JOR-1 TaxID=2599399 RepID=UPI0011984128|nr:hypothetical protein [Salarchaeum sp. JOR-1]QDX41294.1 hypothetical protein FQU85_10440 [Salarchaeum sp. JOR-1]
MPDKSDDGPQLSVDIANQISTNSGYFVVSGVFAAFAVYIYRTLPANPGPFERFMYIPFIALSIFSAAMFYAHLASEVGSWGSLWEAHFQFKNVDLFFFTTLILTAVSGISSLPTGDGRGVILFLIILMVFASIFLVNAGLRFLLQWIPETAKWRLMLVFSVSIPLLIVCRIVWTSVLNDYSIIPIQQLSLTRPVELGIQFSILLVAILQSMAAMAIIAGLLSIPLVLWDEYSR